MFYLNLYLISLFSIVQYIIAETGRKNIAVRNYGLTTLLLKNRHPPKIREIFGKIDKFRRGVCSFSVFGAGNYKNYEKRYLSGILSAKVPKSFQMVVYVDESVAEEDILLIVKKHGALVFRMNCFSHGYEGTMWRFLAIENTEEAVIICDADDRGVSKVIKNSVEKWLSSKETFFAAYNYILAPHIFAAQWGIKGPASVRNGGLLEKMYKYANETYGADEAFLMQEIYPHLNAHNTFFVFSAGNFFRMVMIYLVFFTVIFSMLKCSRQMNTCIFITSSLIFITMLVRWPMFF